MHGWDKIGIFAEKSVSRMKIHLIALLACFLVAACSDGGAMRRLDAADSLLDDRPDSALSVVRSIDAARLHTEEGRARHSLLLSLAMLKTGEISGLDSLLRPAVEYYGLSDTPSREAMLTHFAQGAAFAQTDSIGRALDEYDKSITLASGKNFAIYQALAFLNKSAVYHRIFNIDEERKSIEAGKRLMLDNGCAEKIIHAYIVSATAFGGSRNYDLAINELDNAKKYALSLGDSMKVDFLKSEKAYYMSLSGRHRDAIKIFQELNGHGWVLPKENIMAYVRSLAAVGDDVPDSLICEMTGNVGSLAEKASEFYTLSEIYVSNNDYRSALTMMDSLVSCQEEAFDSINALNVSLYRMETNLKRNAEELSDALSRENTLLIILGMIGIGVGIGIIAYIYRKGKEDIVRSREKYRRKENGYISKIGKLEALNAKITEFNDAIAGENQALRVDNNSLKEDLKAYEALTAKLEDDYRGVKAILYNNSISYHRAAATQWQNPPVGVTKKELDVFYKDRSRALSVYRREDYVKSLEDMINAVMENVVEIIRRNTSLSESNIRLVIYDILGFNYTCIAEIMEISETAASTRRYRVKKALLKLSGDNLAICKRYVIMISDGDMVQ